MRSRSRSLLGCVGVFAVVGFGTPVLSQEAAEKLSLVGLIEGWSKETGVVVTAAGEETAIKIALIDFGDNAMSEGVQVATIDKLAAIMIAGGTVTTEPGGKYGYWTDGNVRLPINSAKEYEVVFAAFTDASVSKLLRKRPRVKISVEPVPPRDYLILINGNIEQTTELGEYLVDEGLTHVVVKRTARKDCEWEGSLAEGDVQPINCKM